MRRLVIRTVLIVVALALLTFAVPLGVVARFWFFDDEQRELEREALSAVTRVGPSFAAGDPVELAQLEADTNVAVYDQEGRRVVGSGPATLEERLGVGVRAGSAVDGRFDGQVVVVVPVSANETVIAAVRASVPVATVWRRIILTWIAELILVLVALTATLLVARRQARLLSEPLEDLSAVSLRIADGDLTARARTSRIREIAQVAATQNFMVDRLSELLDRGRQFTLNASHQLRTPLAGLQLGLDGALDDPESGSEVLREHLRDSRRQVEELHRRLDDVLRLAGGREQHWSSGPSEPLADLLDRREKHWHGRFAAHGRIIRIDVATSVAGTLLPGQVLRQVLDALIDNSLRHGRGTLTVTGRELGDAAVLIDIADEGAMVLAPEDAFERGVSGADGSGIGLSVSRELVEAVGGRLLLSRTEPTTFTIVLTPPAPPIR